MSSRPALGVARKPRPTARLLAAAILGVAATAASAQQYTLQKSNSISLSTSFFAGTTPSQYGTNVLSVTFDGTDAFVGGYNNTNLAGSTGVVRIADAIGASPGFLPLGGSGAIVPTPAFRGLDNLANFGGDVIVSQVTGNTSAASSAFIRRINGLNGNTVWNTDGPNGLQPYAIAIDPRMDAGQPAVGFTTQDDFNGGQRFGLDLDDGTPLAGFAGIFNTAGQDIGFSSRGLAFDAEGNVATITGRGVGYGRRVGDNNFVNATPTGGGAGVAGVLRHQPPDVNNNGNAVAILEGAATVDLLATSVRVSVGNDLILTQRDGTVQAAVDARDIQIRNLDGSLLDINQPSLIGNEDFLGAEYTAQIKNLAVGRDANNNPVLLVVDFASNRLDIYQIEPTWTSTGGGAWGQPANWRIGLIADGATQNAKFGPSAAAQTVTLDTDRTTKLLKFESANAYTINGTNTLTLDAPDGQASNVSVTQGSHTINAPVTVAKDVNFRVETGASLTITNQIAADGRGITKRGAGALSVRNLRASAVNLAEGPTTILANGTGTGASRVGSLALNGGNLDLTDNVFVVDYGAADPSPFAALKAAVLDGTIRSSLAVTGGNTVVGIVEGSAIDEAALGLPVASDDTSVLIRYVLRGDSNIDRSVNFGDLLTLAQNYNEASGAEFSDGDSNYDGAVNFADLLALAQNYNGSLGVAAALADAGIGEAFVGDWNLAASLVPEPTTAIAAASLGLMVVRRRRA